MHHPRSHTARPAAHLRAAAAALRSATGQHAPDPGGQQLAPVRSHARVTTGRSERYGKQLCDHAAWKASHAQWTPPDGVIEFPGSTGTCRITARPDCLLLAIEAATSADLARLQRIIGGSIERFAAREGLTVAWTEGPDPTFKSFI